MQRSKLPYLFLGLSALLAISALVMLLLRPGMREPQPTPDHAAPLPGAAMLPPSATTPATEPPSAHANPDADTTSADPAELVNRLAAALDTGELTTLEHLLRKTALDPQTAKRLNALVASHVHLRPLNRIREIGELELNGRTRWALTLNDQPPGREQIFLELRRNGKQWQIDKISLPAAPGESQVQQELTDLLGVADTFLQAVLNQDFERASEWVAPASVSDTKIAGLCILFEEGGYKLRKFKPLRTIFQRQDKAGFLANVETSDGSQSAQFSLTLSPKCAPAHGVITEINLDDLLADYSRRVAGGDVYYSPLVKNPAGGDTLALYFEFDQDQMNPRTRRQLEIVSHILRADPGKKLTLSGHTDALGTDPYNHSLSSRRADVVRNFLISAGVQPTQIVSLAKGASQPRRPNLTEAGQDNPSGRRANRRTEIYLDF